MSAKRSTGPRVLTGTGPRVSTAQPDAPTTVYRGGDRALVGAREVDIEQLSPDPDQPRKRMDPEGLAGLAASITAEGVLQALLVREDGMDADGDMRYIIIAGGRRYAAIRLALDRATNEEVRHSLSRVPILIRNTEEAKRRVLQLVENLQREDLPPIEEARALQDLMQLENLTTIGVAERIHRSQGYVDERLRLLRHGDVEEAVEAGVLRRSAAAAIASLASGDERRAWIARAQAGETIRPREVYANKPTRRQGRRSNSATPSEPPASTTPEQLKTGEDAGGASFRSGIASFRAPVLTGDTTTDDRVPQVNDAHDAPTARVAEMSGGAPSALSTVALVDPDALHATIDAASADQRAFAERLLAIGADRGWTCAELSRRLRDDG